MMYSIQHIVNALLAQLTEQIDRDLVAQEIMVSTRLSELNLGRHYFCGD